MPDYTVTVCLPNEPPFNCATEAELKTMLLQIVADPQKDRWYDFMCFANQVPEGKYLNPFTTEGKVQYLLNLEGTAILRKHAGKLSVVTASGMFVGILERLGL